MTLGRLMFQKSSAKNRFSERLGNKRPGANSL
jgi:hypothetical protein